MFYLFQILRLAFGVSNYSASWTEFDKVSRFAGSVYIHPNCDIFFQILLNPYLNSMLSITEVSPRKL